MRAEDIRRAFLAHFEGQGHTVIPGIPLPLEGDPTLLFTAAGMVPIKPYFQGVKEPPSPRLASVQKCLRTSDIDEVGKTPRHLTFFEMLGNFSVGDYFKREAIEMAWELVREGFDLDPERLWVTVHEDDDEAAALWTEAVGFPAERIQRLGADNFWSAGPTGPCGPCSEIFFDFGEGLGPGETPADDGLRYMEIWNLVFMQYDRQGDGSLPALPSPSVDTGMGLERIAAALQETPSVFHTDLFTPLRDALDSLTGGGGAEESVRVVLDHLRCALFAIADGVYPANVGRGYVLRRIVRRAVRAGRALGLDEPFLSGLVPAALEPYGPETHPGARERAAEAAGVLRGEEEAFLATLGRGERELESRLAGLQGDLLPGEVAFELYDTHGLPLEATEEACHARGIRLDRDGFEAALAAQRARSQADRARKDEGWQRTGPGGETERLDFGSLEAEAEVLSVAAKGDRVRLVVDRTPFYVEGGGQVGDHGVVAASDGTVVVEVDGCTLDRGEVVHEGRALGPVEPGDKVVMRVDGAHRAGCRRAHTATHLLHAALREVFGEGARQAGSLVEPDRLRFDVTVAGTPDRKEADEVAAKVAAWVAADHQVEIAHTDLDSARAAGAMALFGEKYDAESVRTVKVGSFSLELCGGTHCSSTGQVGACILTDVSAVAQGVRRFEALTGARAQALGASAVAALGRLAERWSVRPDQVEERAGRLEESLASAEKALAKERGGAAAGLSATLLADAPEVAGMRFVASVVPDPASLQPLAQALGAAGEAAVGLLAAGDGARVRFAVFASPSAQGQGADAGRLLAEVAPLLGGRGGGNAGLAQGGGDNPDGFGAAAAALKALL